MIEQAVGWDRQALVRAALAAMLMFVLALAGIELTRYSGKVASV